MRRLLAAVVWVIGPLAVLVSSASAQSPPQARPGPRQMPIEIFTSFAGQAQSGAPGVVAISITRWSTDAERDLVLEILKEAGKPEMIAKLQNLPQVGSIKAPNTMSAAVFYARSNQLPDGTRQVVIGTDGSIGTATPPSSQHDATVIELRFQNGSDKGEGKIVLSGKASVGKDGELQISDYPSEPVRLVDVKARKP